MTGHYESERSVYFSNYPYLYSVRRASVTYSLGDYRFCHVYYRKSLNNTRQAYLLTSPLISDRNVTLNYIYKQSTSRLCFLWKPEPALNERKCTYVSGSQYILYALAVPICYSYENERLCFVEQAKVSKRYACYKCPTPSDRFVIVQSKSYMPLYEVDLSVTLSYFDERAITYSIGSISNRQITLVYRVHSEVICFCANYHQVDVYAITTRTALQNLSTERKIFASGLYLSSERKGLVLCARISERQIVFNYRCHDERHVTFYIGRVFYLYDFLVSPSTLNPTERLCITRGIVCLTERSAYMEMRPIWKEKTPLASSPLITIRANQDVYASIKIVNDRQMEIYGLKGQITEQVGISMHKIVQSSKSDSVKFSAVDNRGAAINSSGEASSKTLLKSYVFKTTIDVT